jgi:hypothetical protein
VRNASIMWVLRIKVVYYGSGWQKEL